MRLLEELHFQSSYIIGLSNQCQYLKKPNTVIESINVLWQLIFSYKKPNEHKKVLKRQEGSTAFPRLIFKCQSSEVNIFIYQW